MFDLVGVPVKPRHRELVKDIKEKQYDRFFEKLENDLEKVAIIEDGKVESLKKKARSLGATITQMTGSGPTVFAFCSDLTASRKIYNGLKGQSEKAILTHTTPYSQVIV